MSRKTERLINLTIALLATKRYLTKREIFRSVDGYEGSDETKERMFERDKDDLRNLGVVIEVGSFNPVFEDEAGYRIAPESYTLNLGDISGPEIALLGLAAEAWRGAALDGPAQSALTKLRSMGVASDVDSIPAIAPRLSSSHPDFQIITNAISKRETISFGYLSPSLQVENRTIEPYAIATSNSHWYLAGQDLDRNEIRTFRLDRIEADVFVVKNKKKYEIPQGFDLISTLKNQSAKKVAHIDIRKGKAQLLRNVANSVESKGEWDRIQLHYLDSAYVVDLVLWHGSDALIIGPEELRSEIIHALNEIVALHG